MVSRDRSHHYLHFILLWLAFGALSTLSLVSMAHAAPYPSAEESTVRFAIIGDFGSGGEAERDVAQLIAQWHPDFILTVGDNRYGHTTYDQVIGQFFCPWLKGVQPGPFCSGDEAEQNAFFPALGNHDYSDGQGLQEYLDYFTLPGNERYYNVRWGPVHAFLLNSNLMEPDGVEANGAQAQWLRDQLARSTAAWKLVLFHHPPYSSSSVHGSSPWMQWPFAAWGADGVIAGHDHTYERLQIDGIPYFVNGAGGQSLYPLGDSLSQSQVRYNQDYGAMLVEATATRIEYRFITRHNQTVDTFQRTISQTQAPISPSPPARKFHWSGFWSDFWMQPVGPTWTLTFCLHPPGLKRTFCLRGHLSR